jgi:hypothetical protein
MQGMIRGVKKMLNPEGLFYFEVQYLLDISNKKLLGTIFHEHMIHYSLVAAKNFLEANEFKLVSFEKNSIQRGLSSVKSAVWHLFRGITVCLKEK